MRGAHTPASPFRATLTRAARALKLTPTKLLDRETARTQLLVAALPIIVLTVALPGHARVDWPLFTATVLAIAATAVASAVPACRPLLNRVGGLLIAGEIAVLVAATGGADSPYGMLYGILLIYGTMFYGTRRLAATAVVLLALYLAPHAAGLGHHATAHWSELAAEIGFWAAIAAVTHGLMNRVRTQTRALEVSEQRYRSLFAQNPQGVFSLRPDGRFASLNEAGGRLLGVAAASLVGREFRPFVAPAELPAVEQRFRAALDGEPQQYETTVRHASGRSMPVLVSNFPVVVDGEVVGVHGVLQNISERKALEERLIHAAAHDPLTGLANRTLLMDRLRHALDAATRTGRPVALLALDLDGFKPVNDTHGHAAGDALLIEIVARLAECCRAGDTLARIGGDEFALLLPDADRSAAAEVAERILEVVAQPVTVDDVTLTVSASIGSSVATVNDDGQRLLHEADTAMYAAKRRGRARHVAFAPGLEDDGEGALRVDVSQAHAWADYTTALRAEIAARKEAGELPESTRGPASLARVLDSLLAAIAALPEGADEAELALPARTALQEFVYHHGMVHDWVDGLVEQGVLTTRRPAAADRFWSDLQAAVADDVHTGA